MTKRVVIAVILFVLSMSVSICSNIYSVNALGEMKTVMEENSSRTDKERISEVIKIWKESRFFLSVFLKHTDADMLDRYVSLLEVYLRENNEEHLILVFGELEAFVRVTFETEKPEIENIF